MAEHTGERYEETLKRRRLAEIERLEQASAAAADEAFQLEVELDKRRKRVDGLCAQAYLDNNMDQAVAFCRSLQVQELHVECLRRAAAVLSAKAKEAEASMPEIKNLEGLRNFMEKLFTTLGHKEDLASFDAFWAQRKREFHELAAKLHEVEEMKSRVLALRERLKG